MQILLASAAPVRSRVITYLLKLADIDTGGAAAGLWLAADYTHRSVATRLCRSRKCR